MSEVKNAFILQLEKTNVLYAQLAKENLLAEIRTLIKKISPSGNPLETRDLRRLRDIAKQVEDLEMLTDNTYGTD